MKLDENIWFLPRCEEPKLLVERGCLFCIEHRKRFDDFLLRYEIDSELDNMLKVDEEFRNEFLVDVVYDFCYEEIEEWHKNNTFPIKKKKAKKKAKKKKKRK